MNEQLARSYETEIAAWFVQVANKLDLGRVTILEAANDGAVLGGHIAEWRHAAGVNTDEAFWRGLGAFVPEALAREDVVRFALRAMQLKKKAAAELTDFSQLTFALAMPGEEAHRDGPPARRESNEVLVAQNSIMRVNGFFTEWLEKEPLARWDRSVKESMREALWPLVELWERLEE